MLGAASASAAGLADNLAFLDAPRTQSAVDQATSALTTVLSYEYRTLDANAELAKQKGTDQYVQQHTELLNKARATATKQKQTVATKVVGVGVRDLTEGSARLLVFLDQTTTRGDTNKAATVGFAAVVDLKLLDGQWKLDSVSSTPS
jgi:Mce-associated membrane protein